MRYLVLLLFFLIFCSGSGAAERKILLIPRFSEAEIKLDGVPDEPFWKKTAQIDDFLVRRGIGSSVYTPAKSSARCCIGMDKKNIYIAVTCPEPLGVAKGLPEASLWSGDSVEFFFFSGKHKWIRQIVIAADGRSYNEFIGSGDYRKALKISAKQWSMELIIPLDKLGRFGENDLFFNVIRSRKHAKELQTWSRIRFGQDTSNYGNLQFYTPPEEIVHGPWMFDITSTSAGFNWETAGETGGKLFLRQSGSSTFREYHTNIEGGIARQDQVLHPVKVSGLKPDTVYEYHTGCGKIRKFRTLAVRSADFRFAMTSDIHSRSGRFAEMLRSPQVQNADMIFMVGDMVTAIADRKNLYDGFLDALAGNWSKPAYYFRGNHEYLGKASGTFFDLLAPFERKAYGAVFHKGVCFVMLDGYVPWDIAAKYLAEQEKWLFDLVKSKKFRDAQYRVIFHHYPLFNGKRLSGNPIILKLFRKLPQAVQNSFDLALGGHVHSYDKVMPGDKKLFSTNPARRGRAVASSMPFPALTCTTDGVILTDKTDKSLTITVIDGSGRTIDKLTLPAKKPFAGK